MAAIGSVIQRPEQTAAKSLYVGNERYKNLQTRTAHVTQSCRNEQLRFYFAERAIGNRGVMGKLTRAASSVSFRKVGWDGHRSLPHLRGQPMQLLLRPTPRFSIYRVDEIHAFLPSEQILKSSRRCQPFSVARGSNVFSSSVHCLVPFPLHPLLPLLPLRRSRHPLRHAICVSMNPSSSSNSGKRSRTKAPASAARVNGSSYRRRAAGPRSSESHHAA
jgi:hypothetical protein